MFKKKKVEEEKISIKTGSKGCIRFVDARTLAIMYDELRLDAEALQSKVIELVAEKNKLKEENAKLKAKNEQINNISLNIGATSQELAKQIRDNLLKDKENKTLADDLKAINKDLKECSFVESNNRAKYWMTKLESLYPHVDFMIFCYEKNYCQISAGYVA